MFAVGASAAASALLSALQHEFAAHPALACCLQYVCVSITQDVALSFGGSEAPAAHAVLTSIGGLGPNNASLSKSISGVLQAKFSVPANRFYCEFRDVAGGNMVRAAARRHCAGPTFPSAQQLAWQACLLTS